VRPGIISSISDGATSRAADFGSPRAAGMPQSPLRYSTVGEGGGGRPRQDFGRKAPERSSERLHGCAGPSGKCSIATPPNAVRMPSSNHAGILLAIMLAACSASPAAPPEPPERGLRVVGGTLMDASGDAVEIHGVNYAGGEYECRNGHGVFDGPTDQEAVDALVSWNVNYVVINLNESCWLGNRGAEVAGRRYRNTVARWVHLLTANGMIVELRYMWTTDGRPNMTNRRYSPRMWASVARRFKSNGDVVFGLLSEPYPMGNSSGAAAWRCWRDGWCSTPFGPAAGMQELIDAVRAAGAGNVILLSGVGHGTNLNRFLDYVPRDPLGRVVAAVHVYPFGHCASLACWNAQFSPIIREMPLVAGEVGEEATGCDGSYVQRFMRWADAHGVGYVAWTWNTWDSDYCPVLIESFDGTPHGSYGAVVRKHFLDRSTPRGA
jgi:endoglucanase